MGQLGASLIRLEKAILKYEEPFPKFLTHTLLSHLSRAFSPKGTSGSLSTAIQAKFNEEAPMPNKMPNPFRAISGNTTPKKSQGNPSRAIFSDYPAAHSAITSAPAAKGEKIPSPTPGMPTFDNPFARLPPTIDLPETPEKYTGGLAPDEIKARVASGEFTGVDVTERPLRALLPPTPVQIQAARHDGEVPSHDSTAGHTPPLSNLTFARQIPERSISGLPPGDPLAVALAGQGFRYAQDVASSELTNYGNARGLLNMAGAHEESDAIKAAASVGYYRHHDLVLNPTGMSASGRLQLMGQSLMPVHRDPPNQELEMFETSTSVGSRKVGSEYGIGVGNGSAGSVETFLEPVTYMPIADNSRLSSVGSALPVHPAVNQERDWGDEGKEPMHLRRRVVIPPAPYMSRHQQVLDPGGSQSSSTQSMSADSSFRRGRPASRRFQSPETLASLTGEGPQGSQQDMQTLIKDVGAMFGVVEEDGAVFEDDIVAVQLEEEGDDCDWETVHESGLKNSIPQKSMTHHDETATSLANMSSYASLTRSVPATPWGSLPGRARVLTYPAKAAVPSRSRVRTDTKTSLSVTLPEYEASDDLYGCHEHEMTESIRPPSLERPFPALAATNLPSATRQQRSYTSYRHPEPMSEEHKHPFSLTPPTMTPTEGSGANFPTIPGITSNEVQDYGQTEKDKGSGDDTTQTGLVISKKRNTQQLSASVSGYSFENSMPDLRELSRPSNASIDGSYAESLHSGPAQSTSSTIHNSQYPPHASGTFSKTTILGPKSNITGSFDDTDMRAVGSSEVDYSTDSAIMKSHKYERLDDERTLDQANRSTNNNTAVQDTRKTLKNITFAKDSEIQMGAQVPTPVLTKNGLPISSPRSFRIPTT